MCTTRHQYHPYLMPVRFMFILGTRVDNGTRRRNVKCTIIMLPTRIFAVGDRLKSRADV